MGHNDDLLQAASRSNFDRRAALAALAGTAAAPLLIYGTARGQGVVVSPRDPAAASGAGASGGAISSGGPASLGAGNMQAATQTLLIGTLSLQSCQLAQRNAQNAMVKQFAELEAAEQQTVAEILAANGVTPPPMPPEMTKRLQSLQAANGQQFETMFIQEQMVAHQQLLQLQQQAAQGPLTQPTVVLARLGISAINSHIAMLTMIQQSMGTAQRR